MASVVFSSLGQALGGPFGALAGAMAGLGIDSVLMGRGDRLAVGQIQRSAYGVPIPKVYGRARVAGILIWAHITDHGAKGSGQRAGAASLAVAVSSRPIRSVARIWADGREIRNEDGEFESPTTMRVHDGREIVPDPLIMAVEGTGFAPAYGGISYVVFENLSLEAFGNRIPNLSFEIDADDDGPGQWLAELSEIPVVNDFPGEPEDQAVGYVASASETEEDAVVLAQLADVDVHAVYGRVEFSDTVSPYVIPRGDLCVDSQSGRTYERSALVSQRPAVVSVEYLDTMREYQAGLQQAVRDRKGREAQMSLPVAFTPGGARAFAYQTMRRRELAADTLAITLGWKWLMLGIGDVFQLGEEPDLWRITQRSIKGLQVHILASRCIGRQPARVEIAAESGRSLAVAATPIPPTKLGIFETPFPMNGAEDCIWVTANGGRGWRGAAVGRLTPWSALEQQGRVESRHAAGVLVDRLGPGTGLLWNMCDDLVVKLQTPDITLESRTEADILNGANMARIGNEILQFRSVLYCGDDIVRLCGLLRGRFGTEIVDHEAGAEVEVIAVQDLHPIGVSADMVGQTLLVNAEGAGDPAGGIVVEYQIAGRGFGQMASCHFQCRRLPDGRIVSTWIPVSSQMVAWESDDVLWSGGVWRFEGEDGFVFEKQVTQAECDITEEEQTAAYGGLFPVGMVFVVTDGVAPLAQRTTESVRI